MKSKAAALSGISAIALTTGLMAPPAWAADASATSAPPPAGAAAAAPETNAISEVTVFAQKREERIEDVPVAVTAFSAKTRQLMGIETIQSLTDFAPGLSYSSGDDRLTVRGIGRNTDNYGTAAAVPVYYNGIYYGANASIVVQKDDLFINTVEVDRGPQNALHGSNADGGTVNYISAKPTSSLYAEGRVGFGNYSDYHGEAVMSGPLSDNVRIRFGGMYNSEGDGTNHNFDGRSEGGDISLGANGNEYYVEGQLDANIGKLDIWTMVSSAGFNAYHISATEVGDVPSIYFRPGTFSPSPFYGLCGLPGVAGTANGAGCGSGPTVVPGSVVLAGVPASNFPGNNPGNLNPRNYISEYNGYQQQFNDNIALATNLTYHLPTLDITYLGGYQRFNYDIHNANGTDSGVLSYQLAPSTAPGATAGCQFLAAGAGYSPTLCNQPLTVNPQVLGVTHGQKTEYSSHELNFTSTWDSPFQYVAGGYYYHEVMDYGFNASGEPDQPQFATPYYLAAAAAPGACPAGVSLCRAPANPSGAAIFNDTDLTYDDYAAFFQGSYKFSDQWKLTGAIRWTGDKRTGTQYFRLLSFGNVLSPSGFGAATPVIDLTAAATDFAPQAGLGKVTLNPATGLAQAPISAWWGAWTGTADVDWTPDKSFLAYFRYSRGYKSGGIDTNSLTSPGEETASEFVDAFELGAKKTMGSRFTLNGAAYYYNYYNDQVPLEINTAAGITSLLSNIPLAHVYGLELEGNWRPIDPLVLSFSYSFNVATIARDAGCVEDAVDPLAQQAGSNTAGCGTAVDSNGPVQLQHVNGETLPESPRNKFALTGLYTIPFDPGKLTLSGSVIWKDVTYGSIFNRPYSLQPPYAVLNLRAIWASANGAYNVIAFINNVTNTLALDTASGTLQSPQVIGTPEDILQNVSPIIPRTYGLELQYRFR